MLPVVMASVFVRYERFQKVFDVIARIALSHRAVVDHDTVPTFIDAEHASDSDVAIARCVNNLQRVLEPVRGLPWCLDLGWHGDWIDSGVQRADRSHTALCSAS
jgi:hypothetical protein